MNQKDISFYKEDILNRVRDAGKKGVMKKDLKAKASSGLRHRALMELIKSRAILDLGTKTKSQYVTADVDPFEIACDRIEANAGTGHLLTRTELLKGCVGEVKKNGETAVDWLVKECRILKLRRKNSFFYLHVMAVHSLPSEKPPAPPSHLTREEVYRAYIRVKNRIGFSNVEISELQKELGAPMDRIKSFLLEENRKGGAVLSFGDWSLSSQSVRSGAIEIDGKPHLLVRMK